MADSRRYLFGDFDFDLGTFQLRKGNDLQAVEPKALDVLRVLLDRAPHIVDKNEIFSVVWKDIAVTDNALTRVIAQLRRVLGDDAKDPQYIATVATRGYRVLTPVRVVASASDGQSVPYMTSGMAPLFTRATSRHSTRMVVIGVAVIAVLVVSAWLASRVVAVRPVAPMWDFAALASLTPVQMTTATGFDGFLAFSPDGSTIAYSSDRSGTMEVYVKGLVEGSTPVALTTNGRQNVQPAWSPDGRFIAYHEMAGNGIWVIPSRGGAPRQVADFGARPSWSPDGRQLVFHSQSLGDLNTGGSFGPTSTIWTVSVHDRVAPAPLTRPGQPSGSHGMPAWWPDGRRVIFAVNKQTGPTNTSSLWTIDSDGRSLRELSSDLKISPEFAISPDGRGIYFSPRSTHGIWWLPVNGGGQSAGAPRPTGLPATGSSVASITVSLDGRRIGWTANEAAATIWTAGGLDASATGPASPLVLVNDVGWRAGYPAVASDGRVAFVGDRGNSGNQIYLVVPNASPKQLTTDAPSHGGPFWLQGDRELAVLADHGDGPGVWALAPETGRERLLFYLRAVPSAPEVESQVRGPAAGLSFTRDLSGLAVAFIREGVPNIWTIPFGEHGPTGQFAQRTYEKHGGSYASWSPDGRWIAYQCHDRTDTNICVIGADGGNHAQLTHDQGHSFVGGWAPDNETIVFAARRNAVWNVTRVSKSSRALRTLTSFTEPRFYVRYPRWDAANDRVVFERFETRGRIWSVMVPTGR